MRKSLFKYFVVLLVMLGGCSADYLTKKWAKDNIKRGTTITVVNNIIDVGMTENRGMIFGILNGKMPQYSKVILLVLRFLILLGLTIYIWINRKKPFLYLLAFSLIWAGAIGNLIDPFIYGYVVDFLHIRVGEILHWPFYFNLADTYVTIGVALLLAYRLFMQVVKTKSVVNLKVS